MYWIPVFRKKKNCYKFTLYKSDAGKSRKSCKNRCEVHINLIKNVFN